MYLLSLWDPTSEIPLLHHSCCFSVVYISRINIIKQIKNIIVIQSIKNKTSLICCLSWNIKVCLPSELRGERLLETGTRGIVAGWGTTEEGTSQFSDILKKVSHMYILFDISLSHCYLATDAEIAEWNNAWLLSHFLLLFFSFYWKTIIVWIVNVLLEYDISMATTSCNGNKYVRLEPYFMQETRIAICMFIPQQTHILTVLITIVK